MVKFRLALLAISSLICSSLIYLTMTHKITGITELMDMAKAVTVVTKKPPPPPPPPPPPDKPPPPPPPAARVVEPVVDVPVQVEVPTAPAVAVITNPTWVKRPGAGEFDRFYPDRARDRAKGGRVVLNCTVQANGRIACAVANESPEGWGFGKAALEIARYFQMSPKLENGQPTEGGTISVPIVFQMSQ